MTRIRQRPSDAAVSLSLSACPTYGSTSNHLGRRWVWVLVIFLCLDQLEIASSLAVRFASTSAERRCISPGARSSFFFGKLRCCAMVCSSAKSREEQFSTRISKINPFLPTRIRTKTTLSMMVDPGNGGSDGASDLNNSHISTEVKNEFDESDGVFLDSASAGQSSLQPPTTAVEYSFFDQALIFVRAGSGGQGASTYKKGVGGQNGPPDGGNGGRGGNVILQLDDSLNTLAGLNTNAWRPNSFGGSGAAAKTKQNVDAPVRSFRAENGQDGGRQFKSGRYGQDVTIRLPPGTIVQEQVQGPEGTILDYKELGTLSGENPTMVVVQGGEGGEGSGVAAKGRGVRRKRIAQQGGERKTIQLTLKIVADVALVGAPNAGKSTFLAAVTRAKPKIANYPFTTVIPNLGVWIPPQSEYQNEAIPDSQGRKQIGGAGSEGLALCDVPGLIEGAAEGIGLGHAFLRHIERCHVILHLVDPTTEDPVGNFHMINNEITKYGTGQLAKMPQVVVINKMDIYEDGNTDNRDNGVRPALHLHELEEQLKQAMPHTRLMRMSAREKDGVDDLMIRLESFVKKVKAAKESTEASNSSHTS